jgi:hypothetical protein
MPRPGVDVALLETPNPVSLPTDTGTGFAVGLTDRGPLEATLIRSLNQFVTVFGPRVSYSSFYDAVEVFFREGGNQLYVSRVVGPAAVASAAPLLDAHPGGAVSLYAGALGPGAWSGGYYVSTVAGVGAGTYRIRVHDASN